MTQAKTHKMPNLEDGGDASAAGGERTGDHSDEILVAVPAPNSRARDDGSSAGGRYCAE